MVGQFQRQPIKTIRHLRYETTQHTDTFLLSKISITCRRDDTVPRELRALRHVMYSVFACFVNNVWREVHDVLQLKPGLVFATGLGGNGGTRYSHPAQNTICKTRHNMMQATVWAWLVVSAMGMDGGLQCDVKDHRKQASS